MSSKRRFALMFSAATASVLTHLGEYAFRHVIMYEVSRTVYQGAGYIRGRVVPMLSYSGGGDFDMSNIPCLPGPEEEQGDDSVGSDEEVVNSTATDLCGVAFSSTPQIPGKDCRSAFLSKGKQSGFQIGKALPPTAMSRGLEGSRWRPTRAASADVTVLTVGGMQDGMLDITDAQKAGRQQHALCYVGKAGDERRAYTDDGAPIFRDGGAFIQEMVKLDELVSPPMGRHGGMSVYEQLPEISTVSFHLPPRMIDGEGAPAAPIDSEPSSTGVLIHVVVFGKEGNTLDFIFFDDDGSLVELSIYDNTGDMVEVASLDIVGTVVDVTVLGNAGIAVEFTIAALNGNMVEVTIDDVEGKMLQVAVFDAEDDMVLSASWVFQPEAKTEVTEAPMSEVSEGKMLQVAVFDTEDDMVLSASWIFQPEATTEMPEAPMSEIHPSNEPIVLVEATPSLEQESTAVADALAPWIYAAVRGLVVWAWMSRNRSKGKSVFLMQWWVLLCLLVTSSQLLDGLLTVDTCHSVIFLGNVVTANVWLALCFLWKLVGSVGLVVTDPDIVAVAGVYLLTVVSVIVIFSTDQPGIKAEQQEPSIFSTTFPLQSRSSVSPAQPEASLEPPAPVGPTVPLESAAIRETHAAVQTASERKARRKAWLQERRKRARGVHISAVRC